MANSDSGSCKKLEELLDYYIKNKEHEKILIYDINNFLKDRLVPTYKNIKNRLLEHEYHLGFLHSSYKSHDLYDKSVNVSIKKHLLLQNIFIDLYSTYFGKDVILEAKNLVLGILLFLYCKNQDISDYYSIFISDSNYVSEFLLSLYDIINVYIFSSLEEALREIGWVYVGGEDILGKDEIVFSKSLMHCIKSFYDYSNPF